MKSGTLKLVDTNTERIVAASEYLAFDGEAPASDGNGFERIEVLRAAGFVVDPIDFLADRNTERPLGG